MFFTIAIVGIVVFGVTAGVAVMMLLDAFDGR